MYLGGDEAYLDLDDDVIFDPLGDHNHSWMVEKKLADDGWCHEMIGLFDDDFKPLYEWRIRKLGKAKTTSVRHADKLMAKALCIIEATGKGIENEQQYEEAMARVSLLMDAKAGTPEFDELDDLAAQVEAYEDKHYPMA